MGDTPGFSRVDAVAHCVVLAVHLIVVTMLGLTGALDESGVAAMVLGGTAIVAALTVADRYAFRGGKS